MAMQPREIYQAQNARFSGEFTADFTANAAFTLNPSGAVRARNVMVNTTGFFYQDLLEIAHYVSVRISPSKGI